MLSSNISTLGQCAAICSHGEGDGNALGAGSWVKLLVSIFSQRDMSFSAPVPNSVDNGTWWVSVPTNTLS